MLFLPPQTDLYSPAQGITTTGNCNGYIWQGWLNQLKVDLGRQIATQQPMVNLNNAPNLITVLVDAQLSQIWKKLTSLVSMQI